MLTLGLTLILIALNRLLFWIIQKVYQSEIAPQNYAWHRVDP
jgi:hypothetical protein